MPRTPEQQARIRQQRRAQILEAATALFVEHGFTATSVSAIAKEAGVSHGTVFLYFATKEALFEAALLEPLAEAKAAFLRTVREATGTPLERLQTIARAHIEMAACQERYLRLVHYVLGQRGKFPELADQLTAFFQTVAEALKPIIEEGQRLGELVPGDPLPSIAAYFAFVQGAALVYLMPPHDHAVWEPAVSHAIRLFGPARPTE